MHPSDRTRRRLTQLGGVLTVAVALVLIAIVVSTNNASSTPKKHPGEIVAGQTESRAMLAGIPQSGITLGSPKAQVTILEFADLQCPFCREYSLQTLPLIVQDYVRSGKAKIEFRNLSFIGPDSVTAGKFAAGAAAQNKLWNFVDVFYFNQKQENSGYATDQFIAKIASAVPGLNSTAAKSTADAQGQAALNAANALASQYGVTGTPTLVVGKTGGTLSKVNGFDLNTVKGAIDKALVA
jgi:protein-disulfide isomerase